MLGGIWERAKSGRRDAGDTAFTERFDEVPVVVADGPGVFRAERDYVRRTRRRGNRR